MKKGFKFLKRFTAVVLTVILMSTPGMDVQASEVVFEDTVSQNGILPNQEEETIETTETTEEEITETDMPEEETGWYYDPNAPFTQRNGIPTEWVEASGMMQPEAVPGYLPGKTTPMLTKDAFVSAAGKKGVQGDNIKVLAEKYGIQQAFMNMEINRVFGSSNDVRYEFEGRTYWFIDMGGYVQQIKEANRRGIPVSVTLLLTNRNKEQGEALIVPSALNNLAGVKTPYFAANASSHYYRAAMDYLAKLFSQADCHIDNWIVGNEVNMPNHWHYTGSLDPQVNADIYADEYLVVYNAVRRYTSVSRVSICLDHSWQHNDYGRGIMGKEYLNRFNDSINRKQRNVNWCLSYHLYPAILYEPDIWTVYSHTFPIDFNPKNERAEFIDGYNLSILTDYVKNTFGSQHRIMLTEQGFSDALGQQVQAASLALSYYAAKYDPMVDCFIIHNQNEGGNQNFCIDGKLAYEVFKRLDSDPAWVEAQTLPVIGIRSYAEIVPNYGRIVNKAKVQAFVSRLYQNALGRKAEQTGLDYWVGRLCNGEISGAKAAYGFFFSDEFKAKKLSNEEYVELLYNVMMGRRSDAAGKADWVNKLNCGVGREGVFRGFAESTEFYNICNSYGIIRGNITVSEGRSKNPGLTAFVSRLYTKALGRGYDVNGLNDWCNRILSGQWSINDVSTKGFFNSPEFLAKNMSDSEYVKVLYGTFLDRECDRDGYNYWMDKLAKGTSRNDVMLGFANSKEFGELKASFGLR